MSHMKKFTLIELLAVIAIFGILVSILLPSLSNAKRATRSVICMNNLKQISTWGISYSVDSDMILPTSGHANYHSYTNISMTMWYQKFDGYEKRAPNGTVMHCPEATLSVFPRWDWEERNDFDYSLNNYLGAKRAVWTPEIPRAYLLTDEKFWFVDGKMSETIDGFYTWAGADPTLTNRGPWMWEFPTFPGHSKNKANFAFGDGHIESRTQLSVTSLIGANRDRFRGTSTQ